MNDLIKTYKIWKDTSYQDKDMKRCFERKCTPVNVSALIERIADLEEAFSLIKYQTDGVKLSGVFPPRNELEPIVVSVNTISTHVLKKAV